MPNYYTTRFNPMLWPPETDQAPPGVELGFADLAERGLLCCDQSHIQETQAAPGEERWTYRVCYRLTCPIHGEDEQNLESRLDWISPNEYLLP
jgi:hypothetical protein